MNSGGKKQIGNPILTGVDLGRKLFSLIITFSEIEVVMDTLKAEGYTTPTPVYLHVEAKRMLIINKDVLFWYPVNTSQNARRWVEFKVMETDVDSPQLEKEMDT